MNENFCVLVRISLTVSKGPIDNNPALVQIMAIGSDNGLALNRPQAII